MVQNFPDSLILQFDKALRTLLAAPRGQRPSPAADLKEADLDDAARQSAAALMRVNHSGEVCAQALYQGQALASDNTELKSSLARSADEELDHLAWSRDRIEELGGNTSLLNPLWYAGSLAIGLVAGRAGDAWNPGFLAETETQVAAHLGGHLQRLNPQDVRTRAVIEAMQSDEAGHAQSARDLGARELPPLVKSAMRCAAKVMTTVSYRI